MTRKTRKLYKAVLKKLKKIFKKRFLELHITIELIVTDYERAMMDAFRSVFKTASVEGCWFHYGQVIFTLCCLIFTYLLYFFYFCK